MWHRDSSREILSGFLNTWLIKPQGAPSSLAVKVGGFSNVLSDIDCSGLAVITRSGLLARPAVFDEEIAPVLGGGRWRASIRSPSEPT